MKLQDYLASSFDHSNFNDSYDNDNDSQTIASEFLVPALKHCKKYRRTTYSFTSAALKSWSGSFANIISDDVQIEIDDYVHDCNYFVVVDVVDNHA